MFNQNCTIESKFHMNFDGMIMRETPLFQYVHHVSDCSVQCAVRNRNRETTLQLFIDISDFLNI